MKRIFYILFISLTVISSFGFGGCDDLFCVLARRLTKLAYGNNLYIAIEENKINLLDATNCQSYLEHNSISALANIKSYSLGLQDNAGLYYFCAVGDSGEVVWSPDGGTSWEERGIPGLTKNLYDLDYFYVFQEVGVVVCGDSGIICISTDSGINWAQHNTITTNKLNSIMAYGGDNVVAVGDHGTIIKGGPQFGWEDLSVDPNINLYKIFKGIGLAYSKLWVVGSNGKIYYSTNYGYDWDTQNSGVTTDLYDIQFRNENEGIVVGAEGVVRYTTNGGLTWLEDPYFSGITTDDIISLAVRDDHTATALIRGTTLDGGVTTTLYTVSSEPLSADETGNIIPSEYSLEQNYPNPFNPSTKINYAIPQPGFVSLKVYDVLGKEVATLVNEEKTAGKYEVSFDASRLTSDIYFYQLKVGDEFIETKKLVLMK